MEQEHNKPARIVIQSKSFGSRFEHQFFKDIEAAILDGYRIADTGLRADMSMRNFKGRMGRAVLILESSRIEVEKDAKEELKLVAAEKAEKVEVAAKKAADELKAKKKLEVSLAENKKVVSTGVVENSPVEAAVKADAAEKKAAMIAKGKATKAANKAKKDAERTK